MPRYYFDLREGDEVTPDEEGSELPTGLATQAEAAKSLSDIIREDVHSNPLALGRRDFAIDVRNDAGPVVQVRLIFELEAVKNRKAASAVGRFLSFRTRVRLWARCRR
ncbi:DUF6894 family protein [Bradyrhizobium sp. PMVTL-01]|uniref:DUF6894 family protein n=1 Tax=Bradyrhizobium sp. PMVTL-01 TaxID=3434999 RepID=UPI003F711F5B